MDSWKGPGSWQHAVDTDRQWILQHVPARRQGAAQSQGSQRTSSGTIGPEDFDKHFDVFLWTVAQHPVDWTKLCVSGASRATVAHVEMRTRCRRQAMLEATCVSSSMPSMGINKQEAATTHFWCYDCGEHFASSAAWAHHRRRAHGAHRPARYYARSCVCPSCGMGFHT